MPNWEYKLISSGPLGFVSLPLLEQHLNQLGKEEWEIISFITRPDNPLVFHGLARRPISRDWFPPAEQKPAYTPPPIPKEEEDGDRDERSFADELPPARPANAPAQTNLGLGNFDDIGSSEENLPTLFEALQPHLRKNQRGEFSVGLDFLAKKFEQDERDLLAAFAECGLRPPAGAGKKGSIVEHDRHHYWLETDQKGRVWINTREQKFKTVRATAVEPTPAAKVDTGETGEKPRPAQLPRAATPAPSALDSFLGRIHGMMRRNRRGQGWSGSFAYLSKALQLDDAQLLARLGEQGLHLPATDGQAPVLVPDGEFLFWLNRNHRGEIWINARHESETGRQAAPKELAAALPSVPPENTLGAVRLLLQPKKRGEGVTAPVAEVAEKLEQTPADLLAALAAAGLRLPEDPKGKPTFAGHGGEIFWLNQNSRGQVWINAKPQAAMKKTRGGKRPDATE